MLNFYSASGVAVGSAITWITAMTISPTGICNFPITPTINGTNILTETTGSNSQTSSDGFSANLIITCKRIGFQVISIFSTTGGPYTNSGGASGIMRFALVPSGFRPSASSQRHIPIFISLHGTSTLALCTVTNGGDISISTTSGGTFPINSSIQIGNYTLTWLV